MHTDRHTRKTYSKMLQDYPDVLDVEQIRNVLGGISKRTIYKLLKEGKIDSIKVGREYRVTKINMIDFLMNIS